MVRNQVRSNVDSRIRFL